MQYKKEELMAVILENAEREFMQKGYQNASLRAIAKHSGTTIGNLYHYVENKEALFERLVKQEHDAFLRLLQHHSEGMVPAGILESRDFREWRAFLFVWLDTLMPVFTKRFYILLEKSGGSRFEHTRDEFAAVLEQHFTEHLKEMNAPIHPQMGKVIAQELLCGVLYVIARCEDPELLRTLICDTLMFTIAGVMRVLGE